MYSDPEGYALVQRRLDVLAKMQGDVVLAVCSCSPQQLRSGPRHISYGRANLWKLMMTVLQHALAGTAARVVMGDDTGPSNREGLHP